MDCILEDVEILLIFLRYDNILRVMFPFFWTFKDMHQLYLGIKYHNICNIFLRGSAKE